MSPSGDDNMPAANSGSGNDRRRLRAVGYPDPFLVTKLPQEATVSNGVIRLDSKTVLGFAHQPFPDGTRVNVLYEEWLYAELADPNPAVRVVSESVGGDARDTPGGRPSAGVPAVSEADCRRAGRTEAERGSHPTDEPPNEPETGPERETAIEPTHVFEPKGAPEPLPAPESEPEPLPAPESEPESEVVPEPEPGPRPGPEPRSERGLGPEPEPKSQREPESGPEPDREPLSEPAPEPAPERGPQPEALTELVPDSERAADAEPIIGREAETEPSPLAEPEHLPAPVSESLPEPVPGREPDLEPEVEPEVERPAATDSDPATAVDPEPDRGSASEPDPAQAPKSGPESVDGGPVRSSVRSPVEQADLFPDDLTSSGGTVTTVAHDRERDSWTDAFGLRRPPDRESEADSDSDRESDRRPDPDRDS